MSWLSKFIGEATVSGVTTTIDSVGDAALKIRTAITGNLPPEKAAELELKLTELDNAVKDARSKVIISESQGINWLQRNWRPLLMLVIIIIVANNYIFNPYLAIFKDKVKILELPDKLWVLMEIGVGGYILGRTAEKIKSAN